MLHLNTSFGLFKDIEVQFLYDDDTATNGKSYMLLLDQDNTLAMVKHIIMKLYSQYTYKA